METNKQSPNYVIYVCLSCGKSLKFRVPNTYQPNLTCNCGYPEYVTKMELIYEGYENQCIKK